MSLEQTSEIQRRMYDFIVSYMKSEGMPPTNREIGRELSIASTGHVDYHLTMLEKKGLISRQPKKSRGIKLTKQTRGIPVKGAIAAGEPLDILPDAMDSVDIGQDIIDSENTYALVVRGRSMIEDHICDGDYVLVEKTNQATDGEIVVALIDGSETTLKRLYREPGAQLRLQPANATMAPIMLDADRVQVQGRVLAVLRKYH